MSPPKPVPDLPNGRETVAYRLTAAGRSAVAVIAVRGPAAGETITASVTLATGRPPASGQIRYGCWHGGQGDDAAGESIVVCPLADDAFELHCHGGPAAVERMLDDLRDAGVRVVPFDVSVRGGESSSLVWEAEAVLSRCTTPRTAAVAADQFRGAMLRWAESVADRVSGAGRDEVCEGGDSEGGAIAAIRRDAAAVLARAAFGVRLAEPFRVVLAGPPNVGKSSLINAIVGYQRSITHHHAGTTRDVLHADAVLEGVPIRLTDTAGIRDSDEAIEREGVSRARRVLGEADLVVWVRAPDSGAGDLTSGLSTFESGLGVLESELGDAIADELPAQLRVFNKCDLVGASRGNEAADSSTGSGEVPHRIEGELSVSAVTGAGVEEMEREIVAALVPATPNSGDPVPLTDRQVAWIRRLAEASSTADVREAVRGLIGVVGSVSSSGQSLGHRTSSTRERFEKE